ncbi:hypothetical protein [Aquimarina sp. AU119]|uniref:hypothetical protein n=1 Tax=Aquimarina sp. AU119 TaxID=2108528 RepID=UPI000D698F4E|nr:hypothetical protein [Aquimarina sp. AU119]
MDKEQQEAERIYNSITSEIELIDYLNGLTVVPDNMVEDYANRFANTMNELTEAKQIIQEM